MTLRKKKQVIPETSTLIRIALQNESLELKGISQALPNIDTESPIYHMDIKC